MTFPAKFPGRCANDCGNRIETGDSIDYSDEGYVHATCATRDPEVRRPICTTCFLEIPMSGVCPECRS